MMDSTCCMSAGTASAPRKRGGAPLLIDLATLHVTQGILPGHAFGSGMHIIGEREDYYVSIDAALLHSSGPAGFLPKDRSRPRFPLPSGHPFVCSRNHLYVPTIRGWDEFDPDSKTYEDLCDPAVPLYRIGQLRFAASAHYGIVGWDNDSRNPGAPRACISAQHR